MNSQRNSFYYHGLRGAASDTRGKHPASPSLHHRYAFLQQAAPPEPSYPYPEAEYLQLESDAIESVSVVPHNSSSLYSDNWQLQDYLPLPLNDSSDAFYPPTLASTPMGLDQLEHLLQSDQPEPQSYNMFGYGQNTFALGEMMQTPATFKSRATVDDISLFGVSSFNDTYDDTSSIEQILSVPVSTSSGHVDSSFPWTSDWASNCSSALLRSVSPMWSSASPNISELSFTGSPLIPSVPCPSSWDPNVKVTSFAPVKVESFAPVKTEFDSVKIEQFTPSLSSVINSNFQSDTPHAKRKTEEEPEVCAKKTKKVKKPPTAHPCTFEGCGKVFDRKSNLGSHLATHYNVREHHCNECDASFLRVYDLDRHIRSHTKEIKYPCTHKGCTKGYGRSDQLKRHLEKNH
ncbi:hypothetical protein BG003_002473 [Podila horticola]|nr:hypothetical protein BG003_002473 [Podila horticola]